MFFEEKTDNESTSEDYSQYEFSSSESEEYENIARDTLGRITIESDLLCEPPDFTPDDDGELGDEIIMQNSKKKLKRDRLLDSKIENLLHDNNVLELVTRYLTALTWNDLTESGKSKVEELLKYEICNKISVRDLEAIFPCSKATIQRIKASKKRNDTCMNADQQNSSPKGRHKKLNNDQIEEFLAEATRKRQKFEPVSLKWGQEFIFKRFSLTVSLPSVHRIFKENNWRKRKVQKRNPKSDPKNKNRLIYLFREYVYGYIRSHNLQPENVHIMDETAIYSNSTVPFTYTYPGEKEAYVITSESSVKDTFIATLTANGNGMGFYVPFKKEKCHRLNGKKVIDEKSVKGVGTKEMKEWIQKFIKYAKPGDLLIMDNLAAHHNKECIEILKSAQIKVCFIPVRCADVLSVLDNAFFAVFKRRLSKHIFHSPEDKKEIIFDTFDNMKKCIGLAMFSHCGYDRMFKEDYSIEFNQNLNYDLEPFIVSENPPGFHFLKENNYCCHLNSCLLLFLMSKKILKEIISSSNLMNKKLKYLINGFKKILNSKKFSGTRNIASQLNFHSDLTLYEVFCKIMKLIPPQVCENYFNISYLFNEIQKCIPYVEIDHVRESIVDSIFNSLKSRYFATLPKILIIYIRNDCCNQYLRDIVIPCSNFNSNFNSFYKLQGTIVIRNSSTCFIFFQKETDHWYEICDKSSILINKPIDQYLNSDEINLKLLLYVVDIFVDEIFELDLK